MVDEEPRPEDVGTALDERARHRRAGVRERLHRRDVCLVDARVVDEIEVERRCEVEARDALALDQVEGGSGVPSRLADEAAADDVHGEQGVDAHRVVERHDPERSIAEAVAVLEHLRQGACTVGAM